MKTIKEIAGDLGVSKQRVYRFIKRERIIEAHHEAGVMYYDDAAETLIKQAFSDVAASADAHHDMHHDAVSDAVTDALIEMLRSELAAKNKELDAKNEQLKEMNARLAESNAALVAAQQTAQAAQALHAGTIQKQLMEPEQSAGFFTRLFSSKNR